MKKELTNKEIIHVLDEIGKISKKSYPFQVTRALIKTRKSLLSEYEIYARELEKIYSEYFEMDKNGVVKKDKNGGMVLKSPESGPDAINAIQILLNETIQDVEVYQFHEKELEPLQEISGEEYELFEKYFICEEAG